MQTHLLFFCLVSIFAQAGEYKYISYGAPDSYDYGRESFRLDVANAEMISADSIEDIIVCGEESEFHCFHNLALTFFVPRSGTSTGQSWDGNGLTFRALREEQLEIFGVSMSVTVIEAKRADRTDYFYYSLSEGLVAIKHVHGRGLPAQFFMVAGRVGFPRLE